MSCNSRGVGAGECEQPHTAAVQRRQAQRLPRQDAITVDWRHHDDGKIGFTADPAVRVSIATVDYRQAVRALDQELMTAMRQRVEELDRRGGLPGVEVDLAELRRDHEERARWRARNLDRTPKTDWAAVRHGARHLLGDAVQTPASTA